MERRVQRVKISKKKCTDKKKLKNKSPLLIVINNYQNIKNTIVIKCVHKNKFLLY